jgi:branched-chain amino acid transport system permease protein
MRLRAFLLPGAVLLFVLGLPLVPFDARVYVMQELTLLFLYAGLAQSYDLVGGTLGYINLGHIVFFGLGAYTVGILFNVGVPLAAGLLAAIAVAAAFAAVVSIPFFRLRGAYFSLATFALVKLMEQIANNLRGLTGGSSGLKILAENRVVPTYYAMFGLLIVAVVTTLAINRSRLGLGMKSIREDEAVARDFGVPTMRIKAQALMISSAFPAVLGGLFVWYINFINPAEVFGLKMALQPVAMAMLGGSGLAIGPLLGSTFLYGLEEFIWTRFEHLHGAMLGLIVVLVGLFMPGGLARLRPVERLLERLGLKEDDQ